LGLAAKMTVRSRWRRHAYDQTGQDDGRRDGTLEGGITVVIDFVAFALQQNKPTLTDSLAYNLLKDFSLPLLAIIWRFTHTIDKQTESYPFAKSASILR